MPKGLATLSVVGVPEGQLEWTTTSHPGFEVDRVNMCLPWRDLVDCVMCPWREKRASHLLVGTVLPPGARAIESLLVMSFGYAA